jgi:hypothetical protein
MDGYGFRFVGEAVILLNLVTGMNIHVREALKSGDVMVSCHVSNGAAYFFLGWKYDYSWMFV